MSKGRALPDFFCWSKMGAEAGEVLYSILNRKEVERKANGGMFIWGVGNSIKPALTHLRHLAEQPIVVFTLMKSNPKPIDRTAEEVLLWVSYYDNQGREQPLPKFSLLTSRSTTGSHQEKKAHYALLCESYEPIIQECGQLLDSSKLCNLLSGRPVGHSQVTSVVKRLKKTTNQTSLYQVGFMAKLKREGQVRLASFVKLKSHQLKKAIVAAEQQSVPLWKEAIVELKAHFPQSTLQRSLDDQRDLYRSIA